MKKQKTLQQEIIDSYGEAEYFKELEEFLKNHQHQYCSIEYDYELNMPIRAVYTFKPILVMHERIHLMKKIAEQERKMAFDDKMDEEEKWK